MIKDVNGESANLHAKCRGKVSIVSKVPVNTIDDLSLVYTPGVAEPCRRIAQNPEDVYTYTSKGNMVAVVSDGSAVLGLGNIGAKAAIPVMEGKAILFKEFAGVDAVSVCLDTQDSKEIIRTVQIIAPNYGGINLEDIASPRCFEIERALKDLIDIPVFHDDQHGTAICVLAGIMNAAKVVNKALSELVIVINGCGAAGSAIARMLIAEVSDIRLVDINGIINKNNPKTMLNWNHEELANLTNKKNLVGGLAEAVRGADVFVGVSKPGLLTQDMVRTMANDAIVFAMANPTPEIFPDEAKAVGAAVVGTGRSDLPNQINNALVFPGIFKGVLAARVKNITEDLKLAAAKALSGYIPADQLSSENILPSVLDKNVADAVAKAVYTAAVGTVNGSHV